MKIFTLDELKKMNPVFFKKETIEFHGDKEYSFDGHNLVVSMKKEGRTSVAVYRPDKIGILHYCGGGK